MACKVYLGRKGNKGETVFKGKEMQKKKRKKETRSSHSWVGVKFKSHHGRETLHIVKMTLANLLEHPWSGVCNTPLAHNTCIFYCWKNTRMDKGWNRGNVEARMPEPAATPPPSNCLIMLGSTGEKGKSGGRCPPIQACSTPL